MTYPGYPPTYPAVPNASYYPPPPTIAPTPQPPTVIVEVRNVQKYFLSLRNLPSTSSCLYTCLNDYWLRHCRDLILRRRGIRSFPFKSDRTKRTKIDLVIKRSVQIVFFIEKIYLKKIVLCQVIFNKTSVDISLHSDMYCLYEILEALKLNLFFVDFFFHFNH